MAFALAAIWLMTTAAPALAASTTIGQLAPNPSRTNTSRRITYHYNGLATYERSIQNSVDSWRHFQDSVSRAVLRFDAMEQDDPPQSDSTRSG